MEWCRSDAAKLNSVDGALYHLFTRVKSTELDVKEKRVLQSVCLLPAVCTLEEPRDTSTAYGIIALQSLS